MSMNLHAVRAIYRFEMARAWRTLMQSIISPVLSTSLYFIVFGAAIGSRIPEVGGVSYGAFIVPGLVMLSLLTQSISNASFGIYFPKFTGTIYELLSAPVSTLEIVVSLKGGVDHVHQLLVYTVAGSAENCLPWPTGRGNYLRNGFSAFLPAAPRFADGFESGNLTAWSASLP